MTTTVPLRTALEDPSPSARLHTVLAAGTNPTPADVDVLVERCAVEPDFFVRDMLTWALTRHPASVAVPRLVRELGREVPQARSQALHTLSKIGDRSAWPAVRALLRDPDDEVARAAWRTAVVLAPEGSEEGLAGLLVSQLDRGSRDLRLSLSRAFVALGEAARPVLARAGGTHALATLRMLDDPELGFEAAVHEARRIVALGGTDADR
jgi:HEAT repeat protein